MSGDATGWTYRHSPYRGSTLAVHVAIADSVNDVHDNEFWMTQARLAAKARVSRESVNLALAVLVKDGFLELVTAGGGRGKSAKYLFLFPDIPVVFENRKRKVSGEPTVFKVSGEPTVTTESVGCADGIAARKVSEPAEETVGSADHIRRTQVGREPKQAKKTETTRARLTAYPFTEFWDPYPDRKGVKRGKSAAAAEWERMTEADRADAMTGVRHLAADYLVTGTWPKDAQRWLRDRLWEDWQEPAKPSLEPKVGPRGSEHRQPTQQEMWGNTGTEGS